MADKIAEMCIATREQDVARHAAAEGSKIIMVKACDTDVLMIAVSCLPVLQALGMKELILTELGADSCT